MGLVIIKSARANVFAEHLKSVVGLNQRMLVVGVLVSQKAANLSHNIF